MRSTHLAIALALAALSACASNQGLSNGQRAPRPERERITLAEIQSVEVQAVNAYELVQRLRPLYLRDHGPQSLVLATSRTPVVYVDNTRLGEVYSLRTIPTAAVQEIKYLSASDATTRGGMNHMAGVIQVTTRR